MILIAQFDKMVDRQFRALFEYEYVHRKVSNFGVVGWLIVKTREHLPKRATP